MGINMKSRVCLALFAVVFCNSACEKNIQIHLQEQEPELVVDASIENDQPPVVLLSKSIDFYSEISPGILEASFVHGADIEISDGTVSRKLTEYTVDSGDLRISYYSIDNTDPANSIIGKLNTSYNLKILVAGKVYEAVTGIPSITRRIDDLWWEPAPNNPDTSLVRLVVKATDPKGLGDYIRYFTKTNTEPFYAGYNSVFDDDVIDGTTYTLPVDRGVDKNVKHKDDDLFFRRGDTVTLKVCNIDKATYDFWRTFEFTFQSIGNPFSSPAKVLGNISNGALGYFGGYAAQFRTIIIPK